MYTSTERLGNLQHRKFENAAPKYHESRVTPYSRKVCGITRPLPLAPRGEILSREEKIKAYAEWHSKHHVKETV